MRILTKYHIQHHDGSDCHCSVGFLSQYITINDHVFVVNPDNSETLLGIITRNTYAKLATDFADYAIINWSRNWDQRTIDAIATIRKWLAGEATQEEMSRAAQQSRYAANRFHAVNEYGDDCDRYPDSIIAGVANFLALNRRDDLPLSTTLDIVHGKERDKEAARQGQYIIDYLAGAQYIFSLGLP